MEDPFGEAPAVAPVLDDGENPFFSTPAQDVYPPGYPAAVTSGPGSPAANGGEAAEFLQPTFSNTEDAFFAHYAPPPQAEPVVQQAQPEQVDPRVEWRRQNAEVLRKKDVEEGAAKQQVLTKAKEHLARFYEVRNTTLTQRHDNNRKREVVTREEEVPSSGTTWQKVHALIQFSSSVSHAKDVTRFKSVLLTCKNSNVAIKC